MNITLACTGYLEREFLRLQSLLPQLGEVYDAIVLSLPSDTPDEIIQAIRRQSKILPILNPNWTLGRNSALKHALNIAANHIHYADLDRVLHWVEKFPDEWRQTVGKIHQSDCLIIGRTERALETHPQALQQTERIVNTVFSHLLGKPIDLGGGSRGFSRRAAQYVVDHSMAQQAWCTDSEWIVLLHQAGFQIDYHAVDGLETTTYSPGYDQDARRWAFRVRVALETVQAGITAAK